MFKYIGGDNFPALNHLNSIDSQELLSEIFPLSQGGTQDRVVVITVNSSLENIELLRDHGLEQNTELLIVNNDESGSILVQINSNFLGLGAAIASQIMVKNLL